MKSDDVGVLHPLQHFQLIVYHFLVALDILLEDDLDSEFVPILLGLPYDAVCTCAQGPAELVLSPT